MFVQYNIITNYAKVLKIMENKVENNTVNEQEKAPKRKLNVYQIVSIVCAALLVAIALGVGIYFIVKAVQKTGLQHLEHKLNKC